MNQTENRQQARKEMMLREPVSRIIMKMALPTIIAFLINSIYSLADTYFVSSLGTNATAAVSVNITPYLRKKTILRLSYRRFKLARDTVTQIVTVGSSSMFCNGLGYGGYAIILATSRQGSCFLPIVYPLAWLFGAVGVASVQAVADVLTLLLAIPILMKVQKRINAAEQAHLQTA